MLLLVPKYPPINGQQAIQVYYKESLGDGYKMTANAQDLQEPGDTVYAAGTFESKDRNGNWSEVLQRQGDESLLIHRLCWNQN